MATTRDSAERPRPRAAGARPGRPGPRRGAGELAERLIAGVPARIMAPRIVFLCALGAILAFGLLMVYSASSVEALTENGSSTYFLTRQAGFIALGLVAMFGVSRVRLETMRSDKIWYIWIALVVVLVLVRLIGEERGGAVRWISFGGIQLQPSEFAKSVIIVVAAKVFYEYYDEGSVDTGTFLFKLAACVLVPLLAIIAEPDLGTCIIIGGTVFVMCYFAGFSYRLILPLLGVCLVVAALFILTSGYRSARLMSDPWADPYGDGYQATLAIMAFASGGFLGRGIGNSTMKYNYLPEAHNDYILAIIGEELGFVGTVIFIAVYVVMVAAAFRIARQAPTFQGRLIASGAAFILILQFLINALGILGAMPMTGKTMPFISYGGSSMIGSLLVAGLIWAVSRSSSGRSVHDERRRGIRVVGDAPAPARGGVEGSTAGTPHRRSERAGGGSFSVVSGGPAGGGAPRGGAAPAGPRPRPRRGAGGPYGRVDLGDDPADRLRTRGPRVRYDGGGAGPARGRRPSGRRRDDR